MPSQLVLITWRWMVATIKNQLGGVVHDELGDVTRWVAQHLRGSDHIPAVGIDQAAHGIREVS